MEQAIPFRPAMAFRITGSLFEYPIERRAKIMKKVEPK
jgi:hypothetical protein